MVPDLVMAEWLPLPTMDSIWLSVLDVQVYANASSSEPNIKDVLATFQPG